MKKIFLLLIIFLSSNDKLWANVSPKIETNKKSTVLSGTDPPQISFMSKTTNGFRANIFDNYTDETNYEFEYKVGNGAWITGLTFGPYASTSVKTISIAFSPPAGTTVGITGRLRAKFGTGAAATYSNYSADYYFIYSNDEPATPLTVGLASLSETTTVMSWTPGSVNETHYVIERADENLNYRRIRLVASNILQINDGGLKHNTFYSYRVMACNASGCSEYKYGDIKTLNGTPAAPSKVGLLPLSPNKILVSWNDIAVNETNYVVQRADENGVYGTIAGVLAPNSRDFIDEKVKPNTRYFYRVAAKNSFATSAFTDIGDVVTPSGIPNMPGAVGMATLSPTRLLISWADRSDDETNFVLQRADINGNYVTLSKIGANTVNFYDGGLTPNTRYFYRVAATNKFGTSEFLNIGDIFTATGNPTNFNATASSPVAVNLSWTDNTNEESGFEIQRADTNLVYVKIGSVLSNVTTFNDKTVKENTKYFYKVIALFGKKTSGSADAIATTPSKIPNSPSNAVAEALAFNKVKFTWKDNSSDELKFDIERSTNGGKFEKIGSVLSDSTMFTDNSVEENTSYIYQVKALSTFGESNFEESNVVKTPIEKVIAPSNLVAVTNSYNLVNLTWLSAAKNVLNYEIERSSDSTTFVSIAKVDSSRRSYNDSSVVENTKYIYRITTIGKLANSETIVSNMVMTPIQPISSVTNFMAEAVSFKQIHLMWDNASKNVTSFDLERSISNGNYELIANLKNDVNMFVDSNLKENTMYSYRIKSLGKLDSSDFVMSNSITTPFEPINKASNLTVVAIAYNEVLVTWVDNSTNETAYVLQKSFDGINFTNIELPANTTTYTDKAVLDNSTYTYKVFSKNVNVNSDTTVTVSAKTPLKPLNPPTNLTLKALSDNEIALTWQDNEGLETGFDIERSKDGVNFSKILSVSSNVITYLNVNLDASTKYYYRVRAFNDKQTSIYSNIADISTLVTTSVIKEKLNGTIKVYPNPTSDFVTVDYPTGTYSVDLFSSFGVSISSKNVDLNSISTEINLNGLPSGVYFVSANSKSNKITKKIIKN